jgi:fatty acid-binding protein DegV
MKIVTDCAADMSAEELERLDVTQAPLFIQFPEGEVNSADISADDFYNRLEAMRPAIPTTAQPSGGSLRSCIVNWPGRRSKFSRSIFPPG